MRRSLAPKALTSEKVLPSETALTSLHSLTTYTKKAPPERCFFVWKRVGSADDDLGDGVALAADVEARGKVLGFDTHALEGVVFGVVGEDVCLDIIDARNPLGVAAAAPLGLAVYGNLTSVEGADVDGDGYVAGAGLGGGEDHGDCAAFGGQGGGADGDLAVRAADADVADDARAGDVELTCHVSVALEAGVGVGGHP